jgi:HKD family nuclease
MIEDLISALFHAQKPGTRQYLFQRINELLQSPGLSRFRVAVAYARWDGIRLIANNIEGLLDAGGEFHAIYGINNGVTTPDSLLYQLYLKELHGRSIYSGVVEDEYMDSTFHSKFFNFQLEDNSITIIGSANLTGAGMSRNTELCCELAYNRGSALERNVDEIWDEIQARAIATSLELIRTVAADSKLGSERRDDEQRKIKSGKPRIGRRLEGRPRPMFAKVLAVANVTKRHKLLRDIDTASDKPERLYLQILPGETGSRDSTTAGYQIQLPVATLAAFFGISPSQTKEVSFEFDGEAISVNLTHFANNTHRMRLRPLRDVARPAIVIFRRIGMDLYECSVVPAGEYPAVLATKCPEQTRAGARRWGLE